MAADKQLADAQAANAAWASALPRQNAVPDSRPGSPAAPQSEPRALSETEGLRLLLDLRPHLLRYMRSQFGFSPQTAEDTLAGVQDRWMQRLRSPDPFKVGQPEAYLRAATRSAAIDHLRRASRRQEILVDSNDWETLEPYIEHAPSAEDVAASGEFDLELVAKVRSLPHMQRRVIELSYLEDRSLSETAELLGLTRATTARHRLRALKALRAMYTNAQRTNGVSQPSQGQS